MDIASIKSDGDLEIVILHEAHGSLASIVGPHLYKIEGEVPEQKVLFPNRPLFDLFLLRLYDFIRTDTASPSLDKRHAGLSLLGGLRHLCAQHPAETDEAGLGQALQAFEAWLVRSVEFGFWSPNIGTEVAFKLTNSELIWFGANCVRNELARLPSLLERLHALCIAGGSEITAQDMVAVFEGMDGEARSRLEYHATHLLEMLGKIFQAVNRVVNARYRANPTADVTEMSFPAGVTSETFKHFYRFLLVFKNYDRERIEKYTPAAAKNLRTRY